MFYLIGKTCLSKLEPIFAKDKEEMTLGWHGKGEPAIVGIQAKPFLPPVHHLLD
jgi:hypothetical protein